MPQQGSELLEKHWPVAPLVTQRRRPSTGLPPPLVKSNVTRRSPAVRFSVSGPLLVALNPEVTFLLISKSMLALPRTFERSQAR